MPTRRTKPKATTPTTCYDYNPRDGVASTLKAFRTCNRTDSWPKSFTTKSASRPAAFLRMPLPQQTGNNIGSRASISGVLLPRHHLPAPTAVSFSSHLDLNRASSLHGVAAQINLQTRRRFPSRIALSNTCSGLTYEPRQNTRVIHLKRSAPRHHCSQRCVFGSITTILNHHYFEKVPTTLKFCGHNIELSCAAESNLQNHTSRRPVEPGEPQQARSSRLKRIPRRQLQRFVMIAHHISWAGPYHSNVDSSQCPVD